MQENGIKKKIWTLDGRKKIILVDEENQIIKEVEDLGPLNETEKLWIFLRPGIPYEEWLIGFKEKINLEKNGLVFGKKKDKKKGKKSQKK